MALSVLDSAIANIALPAIAKEIHASAADSIWIINAYQLAVVISLLPFASLGDIFGYRRIYMIGLVVFTGAALVSALSYSLPMLTLGRALQGLGAAGMMSVNWCASPIRGVSWAAASPWFRSSFRYRRPRARASPRRSSRSPRGRGSSR
jgi:MFS family permease